MAKKEIRKDEEKAFSETGSRSDQTCIKVQKGFDSPRGNISKEVNGKSDSYGGSSQADMTVWDGNDSPCGIIAAHIQSMIEVSKGHLTEDQIHELTACLIEFQDVFAKDEFDFGEFSDIVHEIDT